MRVFATTSLLAAIVASAAGQTVTVTTVDDVSDFSPPQDVSTLPGPDGRVSFREAVVAANNSPGPQTIEFAIPASEFWLITDIALLRLEDGAFSYADDGGTIDFASQTEFTGDTNPNGNEVGIYGLEPNGLGGAAIFVNADGSTIRGLDRVFQRGYALQIGGNVNRVIGCTISGPLYAGVYVTGGFGGPPATGNIVGGVLPGEGNRLSAGNSGLRIDGPAAETVAIGNILTGSFSGVAVRSAPTSGLISTGTRIGGPIPEERNFIYGAGHFGEEGFPVGEQVSVERSVDTTIENNYIGVLPDGVTIPASQRGPAGVEVLSSANTVIRGNVIGGIAVTGVNHYAGQRFGLGIAIIGNSTGTLVYDNQIGVDASGLVPVPNRTGISLSPWPGEPSPVGTQLGGPDAGQANQIAFNETTGVLIPSTITQVPIRGNSIHSNGALGIDLVSSSGGTGVTPNDIGDADTGGNLLQNYPLLNAAESSEASTRIQGTLASRPNQTYTLDFYANVQCDPSGLGEGQTYLGLHQVTTGESGIADFDVTLSAGSAVGAAITATATDATGNTSEFGPCVLSTPGSPGSDGDVDGDEDVDLSDLALLLASFGSCDGDSAFNQAADFDRSGCIDLPDLALLLANFGT